MSLFRLIGFFRLFSQLPDKPLLLILSINPSVPFLGKQRPLYGGRMRKIFLFIILFLFPAFLFAQFSGHDSTTIPDFSPYTLPYQPGRDYDSASFDNDLSPQSALSSAMIEIKSSGTAGQLNSLALDGAPASHTKMAVNGMLINFAQNPVFDMSLLPLEFSSDIEVYRNNLAADGIPATAGLVNFRLFDGRPSVFSAKLEAGSFGFYRGVLSTDLFHKHLKIGLAYTVASNNYRYRDNYGVIRQIQNMDYSKNSLYAEWKDNFGKIFVSRSAKDAGTGDLYSTLAREKDNLLLIDAKRIFDKWQTALSWSRWLNHYTSPGIDDQHNNRHLSAKAGRRWKIADHVLAFHLENDFYYLDSTKIGIKSENSSALNGRALLRSKNWEWGFEASGRYSSIRGLKVIPAFSAAWNFLKGVQFFSRVSELYQEPSFNDLYWPADAFSEGNPNLKPEDGVRTRAGILCLFPPLTITLSGQWNEIAEMILWSNNGGKWRPDNTGRQRSYGVSLIARYDNIIGRRRLKARASFSYQHRFNNNPDSRYYLKDSLYAPRLKAAGRLNLSHGKNISFTANLRYVSPRFVTEANSISLPPYFLADFSIRFYYFTFTLNNLFDEHIEEVQGYPAPGRNWKAGLIFNFD